MEDVVPALSKAIESTFQTKMVGDKRIMRISRRIRDGTATLVDAHRYAQYTGENMSKALIVNLAEDNLPDGTLYFNDQRKFGFIKVIKTSEVENDAFIKKLAKEPWVMTSNELYGKFQRHKNSLVKATILDQSIICGLGNIYADEALFAAGIHPERRCSTITREETAKLLKSACAVMDKSIASGGSTMATYVKADGTKGDYLEKFAQVFHREGQPCPRCSTVIIKTKVAGRGTHLCPHCQELK